jgi:hypothetical protein
VILFGPESWRWGSGSLALRVGVGRRNGRLHCWVCTPSRKIRVQLQECKHTSLNFFAVTFYALRELGALRTLH